jgi:hypothetical protein
VAGGMDGGQAWLASAEIYDPRHGAWVALPPLSVERDRCAAIGLAPLTDAPHELGTVLVLGGAGRSLPGPTPPHRGGGGGGGGTTVTTVTAPASADAPPPASAIAELGTCESLTLVRSAVDAAAGGPGLAAAREGWRPAPPLRRPRCGLGVVSVGGLILAMGGGRGPAARVIEGCPRGEAALGGGGGGGADSWVAVATMPQPRSGYGAATCVMVPSPPGGPAAAHG